MKFTEKQHREIQFLINQLSADMLVEQGLIVEAIASDENIKDSLVLWVKGELNYGSILAQFSEVF